MTENILQQFVGQKIQKVHYFEVNRPNHSFFFDGFDNFDLGIEIEFSDGSHFHVGWKNNDRPEIGLEKYSIEDHHKDYTQKDVTSKWDKHLNSPILNTDLIYISEEWKIPAKFTINFENGTSTSIIMGAELNLDNSLPLPLSYTECSQFYVFHGTELPEVEFVRIILPPEYEDIEYNYEDKVRFPKVEAPVVLMIGFFLVVGYLIIKSIFFH